MNQNSPSTGLKVTVSQFWFVCVSMAPPMPAIADDTPKTNSLARRSRMPTDCAAASESRMAASSAAEAPAPEVPREGEHEDYHGEP